MSLEKKKKTDFFSFLRDKQCKEGVNYCSMWLNLWLEFGEQMAEASCTFLF